MIKNQYNWKEDNILFGPAIQNSLINSNPALKFKLKTFVSKNNFNLKPKGYPDFKFHLEELSIEQYVDKIVNGYAFCHLFNCPNGNYLENTEKKGENYVGANVIVFDLDDSPYQKEYYQENLTLKPTIIYNTFTHNTNQKKKIRLVYVLNRVIYGDENYKVLYDYFKTCIENDISIIKIDNHQRNPTQFYYGTSYKDIIINNIIYSIGININKIDISNNNNNNNNLSGIIYKEIFFEEMNYCHSKELLNKKTITLTNDINCSNKNIRTLIDKKYSQYKDLFIDMNFWDYFFVGITNNDKNYFLNINSMYSVCDFIHYFENEYPVITNTGEVNDEGYTEFDENSKIIKIHYDGKTPRKYHPGEGRRNKLYSLGVQIKEIKPTVSLEQMVLSLVYYFDKMMINTSKEKRITKHVILQKAIDVYVQENHKSYFQKNTKKFKVDKTFCDQNGLKPKSYKNVVVKKLNDKKIGELFDFNLAYEENHKILNNNGVKCSIKRIKKFVKELYPEEYKRRKIKPGKKPKA